jgi:hypothetical protein
MILIRIVKSIVPDEAPGCKLQNACRKIDPLVFFKEKGPGDEFIIITSG